MENTVTISVTEFDELRNCFENSKLKLRLQRELKAKELEIECLKNDIKSIKDSDFFCVEYYRFYLKRKTFFKKDKTPLWIRKIFNYSL